MKIYRVDYQTEFDGSQCQWFQTKAEAKNFEKESDQEFVHSYGIDELNVKLTKKEVIRFLNTYCYHS